MGREIVFQEDPTLARLRPWNPPALRAHPYLFGVHVQKGRCFGEVERAHGMSEGQRFAVVALRRLFAQRHVALQRLASVIVEHDVRHRPAVRTGRINARRSPIKAVKGERCAAGEASRRRFVRHVARQARARQVNIARRSREMHRPAGRAIAGFAVRAVMRRDKTSAGEAQRALVRPGHGHPPEAARRAARPAS